LADAALQQFLSRIGAARESESRQSGRSAIACTRLGKQLEELNIMARKKTASASTARKTIKAQAYKATPLMATAGKTAGSPRTEGAPAARPAAAVAAVTALPKVQAAAFTAVTAPPKAKAVVVSTATASRKNKAAAVSAAHASPKAKAAAADVNGLEALMTAGQDNLAACVTCGTIVAKGLETLGNEVMTLARANIDANLAATKSLMAVKTPHELVDLQTSFTRDRLEGMANETAKIGALTMNVASQALEPLRSRFDANTRSVFRPFGL
jgi:phasin family protein